MHIVIRESTLHRVLEMCMLEEGDDAICSIEIAGIMSRRCVDKCHYENHS